MTYQLPPAHDEWITANLPIGRPEIEYRDGKIWYDDCYAVLHSPGYGVGWSTCSQDVQPFTERHMFTMPCMALRVLNGDRDILHQYELVLDTSVPCYEYRGKLADWLCELYGTAHRDLPCLGGTETLQIEWMDPEDEFTIDCYDGAESITYTRIF